MDSLEKRNKEEVLMYLAGEQTAILSMYAPDGTIDAAAVFFFADEDLNFYFTTKVNTRKYQNITAHSEVTLTISNADTLQTVEVKGIASLITNSEEIASHIIALNTKNKHEGTPWTPPIALLDAGQYVIIKVTPTWIRYGSFLHENPEGQYFKQII